MKNFLSDRTQRVILDGCHSDTLPVTSGVPQGTVLAPLLFLCYINDLPELVSSCCRLYADDVLLYKVIRSGEDCASLQSDLDVLQEWADAWQMRFNALKCQHISFCGKQVRINFDYMIGNEVVKQVDSIKYLGVTIDKKITWSQQVDKIALKAIESGDFYIVTLINTVLWILKTDVTKYLFGQYWSMHRLYGPLTIINM